MTLPIGLYWDGLTRCCTDSSFINLWIHSHKVVCLHQCLWAIQIRIHYFQLFLVVGFLVGVGRGAWFLWSMTKKPPSPNFRVVPAFLIFQYEFVHFWHCFFLLTNLTVIMNEIGLQVTCRAAIFNTWETLQNLFLVRGGIMMCSLSHDDNGFIQGCGVDRFQATPAPTLLRLHLTRTIPF